MKSKWKIGTPAKDRIRYNLIMKFQFKRSVITNVTLFSANFRF